MKTALIYSFNTHNTKEIAKMILQELEGREIDELNAEEMDGITFTLYDNIIIGVPTWFYGELPNYWDEFLPELKELNLAGKKVAIFGLGDQKRYPDHFVDAIGTMAELIENLGGHIVGHTEIDGYVFTQSNAIKKGKFQGLPLDFENQHELNPSRIKSWIAQVVKEFGIE